MVASSGDDVAFGGCVGVTEYLSVDQAARMLGVTLTDTARMIVSGELKVDVPPSGVPLDDVSIRVHGPWLREFLRSRAAFHFSSIDRAEANRIFSRKYSLRGWPPPSWSGSKVAEPVVDVVDDIVNDNTATVLEWLNEREQYETRISDMMESLCVVTKRMSRPEFEAAVRELEALNVVEIVKKATGSRGPRPRVARLYMWFYNAMRDGRPVSIADVRARGGVRDE